VRTPSAAVEKERQGKKLDQSLSGERFNEDDLIRSAAELYSRLSGFSRQSLAASQVARIVGNCFRNPAQMRSRSRRANILPSESRYIAARNVCVYVFARKRREGGVEGAPRRSWCVNHSAQLRQLPDRSQVSTLSAYATTSPFPTPSSIHASRKSCEDFPPTHLRPTDMLQNRVEKSTTISSRIRDAVNVSKNSVDVHFDY